ncbi:MAG TPA: hypothetical protein VL769_06855 [Acidimicrobiia bacterium]|jgi:hypothetical protein|nr:hypothetical protein [Acidimicrobiia bacterium]
MHRHSIDLGGLLFGLAFAIAGTSFLVRETTDTTIDPAWATGLGLMLLGAVALVVTLARATNRDRVESAPTDVPEHPLSPDSDG